MKWNAIPALVMSGINLYVSVYYLLMYIRRKKEKVNLAFAFACLSIAFYDVTCAGLYNSLTVEEGIQWQKGNFAGIGLLCISLIWFITDFTRGKWNIFSKLLSISIGAVIPITILYESPLTLSIEKKMPRLIEISETIKIQYYEVEPGMILNIFMVIVFIGMIYLMAMLIKFYRQHKEKGVLPIIISTLLFFFIGTSDFLTAAGVYPFIYLAEYGFMAIILSMAFALLNRFVSLHETVEELNVGLENKVRERTQELEQAKNALWGEMELAKKIQTMLLPEKPVIKGFDVSAYMEPATEVGGDYYDIINVAGRDWIVVGDVSGHGVSAGLVMMMVQTSVRVALEQNPEMSPSDLLILINKIISYNIKQLGEEKYMTITVLAEIDNSKFYFSGLHQDIIVYRAAEKNVELVETTGMWIGLFDDIHGMMEDDYFTLQINDVMLIYTDGITEAWRKGSVKDKRDPKQDMFGEERLMEIFKNNGQKKPEEIKQRILLELNQYDCYDDVTIVIIKRLK